MKKIVFVSIILFCFLLIGCKKDQVNEKHSGISVDSKINLEHRQDLEEINQNQEEKNNEENVDTNFNDINDIIKEKMLDYLNDNYNITRSVDNIIVKEASYINDEIILFYLDATELPINNHIIIDSNEFCFPKTTIPLLYKNGKIYEFDHGVINIDSNIDENVLASLRVTPKDWEKIYEFFKVIVPLKPQIFYGFVFTILVDDYLVECDIEQFSSNLLGRALRVFELDEFGNPKKANLETNKIYTRIYENGVYKWVLEK